MSTEDILPDAQAPIVKCLVCCRGEDANFYCKECTQEICADCKGTHLRMKVNQNHTVIRIAADKQTSGKCFSHTMCQSHPNNLVQMYCVSCYTPVCLACIADKEHKNHDFDQLGSVADKYKKALLQIRTETQREMSQMEELLTSIQNDIRDYNDTSVQTIKEVNDQRIQVKSMVDKLADCLISDIHKRNDADTNTMSRQAVEIEMTIAERNEFKRSCDVKLKSDIDMTVKDFISEARLKKKPQVSSLRQLHPPVFVRNKDIEEDLKNILGKLEDNEKKNGVLCMQSERKYYSVNIQMHDYKLKTTGIAVNINTGIVSYINPGIGSFSISAVNDKEAWCGGKYGFGRDLILLQTTGKVKKKVKLDTPLYDITVTPSGDVFFSEDEGHTIKMYSSEKFTVIANTTPYKTQGLFITIDQDLLVCLYFDGRKNDNSKVVRMSLNGQIIQTLQYNKENKPLFNNPQLVTENINGDICVVDTSKTVVAVNKDGEFRFKYPESNTSSHTFRNCYGIACDKLGYILISDFGNNRIHQIDSDGKFVQFILTVQHCLVRPWGLSIGDDGQLWVCNKGGSEVRVFIFRS